MFIDRIINQMNKQPVLELDFRQNVELSHLTKASQCVSESKSGRLIEIHTDKSLHFIYFYNA